MELPTTATGANGHAPPPRPRRSIDMTTPSVTVPEVSR